MTSIPQLPGAPAVILYREEITDDNTHIRSFYMRIKVLTEGGKERANVELPYFNYDSQSVDNVAGRTIHPDGTIAVFTGKPYEKTIEKIQGVKIKEKIFTLPAVEVGSIIEYRYKIHNDQFLFEPDFYVQTDLFTKKGHFSWAPYWHEGGYVAGADGVLDRIAWTPILPAGVTVKNTQPQNKGSLMQLDVTDIPPIVDEAYMPPMHSLSYRVLFYYTAYASGQEFWTKQGKMWSGKRDKFIGPNSGVKAQVASIVAPGDTQDQRARKLYAYIMTLENTDFTRQRSTREEQAQGVKQINTTDDILKVKHGTGNELTDLFVAMARAAGLKAYLFGVSDRKERLFVASYLSFAQIDDYLAVVNIDGKEIVIDPGQRYCKFGQLAWQHYTSQGIRQVDGGTALVPTDGESYKDERTGRIADLTLDEHGMATGSVNLSFSGNAALHWRQTALRGDETSLNNDLKENLEHMLPGGVDVKVVKIENLTDGEKPLLVSFEIKGGVGSPTGKRLLVPASLFEVNSKPRFPGDKREQPVDLRYPTFLQDAVRYKLPSGIVIESPPTAGTAQIKGAAIFETSVKQTPASITLYRNVYMGRTFFKASDYPDLRGFYQKIEAKDQEPLVLTRGAPPTSGTN